MKKKFIRIFLILILIGFFSAVGFLALVYHSVSKEAATRIQRGVIDKIIFSESPVYYDDGKNVIGVFFDKTHRQYIHYDDIPPYFIKALVASEDKHFFHHPGFDIKAILRAMIANIRAGHVVQGGSTLSQQTAKNVFERQRRSLKAKVKELMQALLLEREYTKEEILEMYVNQFFVTGFGRGLEIAAQYFFDKEAEDLDLVECAFIAGCVKSPNAYNPFIKKTESQKQEALKKAKTRKAYVLSNMLMLKFITEETFDEAIKRPVPFKEGRVTYRLNVILDYVRERLESDYFRSILEEQGVENIATSGIKIYTSVNKTTQEGALASLRRHLPVMDVKLNGYERSTLQDKYRQASGDSLKKRNSDLPFLCRITHINKDKKNPYILVAWENGGGIVDYEGMKSIGQAWLQGVRDSRGPFSRDHISGFLSLFKEGDYLAIRSVENGHEGSQRNLVLSVIPELEGGIIVLRKGMIKAMVGGFHDRFFNRAVDAKRQLGSIFKPIVYAAALQLKWNILDPLNNVRDLFRFEGTRYLPNPDHKPQSDRVSMIWAGAKSENLATVWLLYHLTDRLNVGEFARLVEKVGLARGTMESYEDYVKKIRDTQGVVVDRQSLMESAFEKARKEIVSDLIFGGQENVLPFLERLHFDIDPTKLDPKKPDEFNIYRLSFKRLQGLNTEMKNIFKRIEILLHDYENTENPDLQENLRNILLNFYVSREGKIPYRVIYKEDVHPTVNIDLSPMTPRWLLDHFKEINPEDIWVDNFVTSKAIELLQTHMKDIYNQFMGFKRYDREILYNIRDFKTLVSLVYVKQLGEELGISTPLAPVLSFPLGASAVSIMEAAVAYHTLMTGQIDSFPDRTESGMTPVIARIEDRTGETIWQHHPQREKILSERTSGLISELLRMVMERGTGQKAKDAVQLALEVGESQTSIPLPSFGKTGTANRYTNSSFVGFIPGPDKASGELDIKEGYVVASYVGYDDNRPMKGKYVTIYGSSGALPLWIDTVNTIVNSKDYTRSLQVADLAFGGKQVPFYVQDQGALQELAVSPRTGLPLNEEEIKLQGPSVRLFADVQKENQNTLKYNRVFELIRGDDNEPTNPN